MMRPSTAAYWYISESKYFNEHAFSEWILFLCSGRRLGRR
jgi:hypothetical protein